MLLDFCLVSLLCLGGRFEGLDCIVLLSRRRRHRGCAVVIGLQTCALPILEPPRASPWHRPGGPAALRHGSGAAPLPGGPDRGRNAPSSLSGAGPHAQAPPPLQLGDRKSVV